MVSNKLSIVIPARNELFLNETVKDILKKATGNIEVIVILDGQWPKTLPKDDPRLILVHRERRGMRASINSGFDMATGEFIMKVDGHCMFGEGYDEILKADCDDDYVVVPRRYALNADEWAIKREKQFIDYEYIGWPHHENKNKQGLHAWAWNDRTISRIDKQIDENMCFQGSVYFMKKEHFTKRLGGKLDENGYGTFIGEGIEISLKTWLKQGKVITNKKIWYAHLWKGEKYREKYKQEYGASYTRIGSHERNSGDKFCTDFWVNNRWNERKYDLEWLVDRFSPYPSSENWSIK